MKQGKPVVIGKGMLEVSKDFRPLKALRIDYVGTLYLRTPAPLGPGTLIWKPDAPKRARRKGVQ